MADVNISKYRASVVRDGSKPASPGFVVSEGQDPVNPPGTNNFVPYTGATANVELGEFGVEAGFVTLDTTPTNIPTDQGAIYWDDTRSTAALIMNGTLQHIGQDSFFYVKNSSGSTIPKGTCVGFAGTDGGSGHLLVTPFLANGSVPSTYFMGVTCESIANGSFGQVMHFGELEGINTSGFTAGALLYASSTVAGAFQTTAPVAPNNIILVAAAVNSKNNGAIVVRPTLGSNINSDEGVKITSPTTGDLLQLQAGGLWENKTLAQVIGSAYVPSTRTLTINGTPFDLSANRSWTVGDVRTDGSYSNPSWITALAWSKITGTPTTLSGYGITDAVPNSRTITINGVTQDLSANRTFNVGTVTSVGLSSATSGVTIGSTPVTSSGTITLAIATASGSQNGLLSSTDWTTFNNKQNALTNPVTGTGTTNYLPKFTGSTTIGNSQIFDNGTNVGIGTASPAARLDVSVGQEVNGYSLSGYPFLKFSAGDVLDYGAFGATWTALRFLTNGSERIRITSGGNLLVGTTTDNGARLQVSGTVSFNNGSGQSSIIGTTFTGFEYTRGSTLFGFIGTENTASGGMRYNSIAGNFEHKFYNNSNLSLTLASTGAATFSSSVTAGGNVLVPAGSGLAWVGDASRIMTPEDNVSGALIQTPGIIRLNAGGNERVRITSSGNVLIGTTTDNGSRLQVSGSATIGGNLTVSSGNNLNMVTGDIHFQSNAGYGILSANSNRLLSIQNGALGVSGTVTASQFLASSSGNAAIITSTGTSGFGLLAVGSSGGARDIFLAGQSGFSNGFTVQYTGTEMRYGFQNGNVLIGTTTDVGARLHVNGDVRTAAPTGGSAVNWRLGTVRGGTVTPNATVRVEIGGVLVDLDARYV